MKTNSYKQQDFRSGTDRSNIAFRKASPSRTTHNNFVSNIFEDFQTNLAFTRMFELQDSIISKKRTYLKQFDENRTTFAAVEVQFKNPYYKRQDIFLRGLTLWYYEDEEVGRNDFNLEIREDWQYVEFVQSWGTPVPGFWKSGDCRVEILLENNLVSSSSFRIGETDIIDLMGCSAPQGQNPNQQPTAQPKIVEQLDRQNFELSSGESVLGELNEFVGLNDLKGSLIEFITYLNFIKERRNKGFSTEEIFVPHCIFLGNPGTGKTSVARLLGKFFKSAGILEHGHVIEVDRAKLIGEYIGQTAQKTEKIISEALGGILFIDEAYSLKSGRDSKDFGQEAIDIILKRMEDYNGRLMVIAAGYSSLMGPFIDSNPGLKSRFTHTFTFRDYSPEELAEIYRKFAAREKYVLPEEVNDLLISKLEDQCSKSNESFGNARFIRNLFSETKMQLSKRYQQLSYENRSYSSLSTIKQEDIIRAFSSCGNHGPELKINTEKLDRYITELNDLVGLEDVKITLGRILSSIRVEQLKKGKGISAETRNLNSLFIANPGSGTTKVANLLSRIFRELNLIREGHVVEIDSSALYGLGNIDSYLFIDSLFQESAGKLILINDAINTLRAKSDFSDSLLQYFLKKLYLNQQKTIAVLTASGEEINDLIENVPVIENQFPNVFNFQEYSNRQLLEIGWRICKKKNYVLDEGAWQMLYELIMEFRKDPGRVFYNARTITEILNKAIRNQENRIISVPNPKDDDLMTLTYEDFSGLSAGSV